MNGKVSKNQIKNTKALHQKKYRDAEGTFLIEGVKLVGEAIATGAKIEMIAYRGEASDFPFDLPQSAVMASSAEMTRMSALKTAPPILGVCRKPHVTTHVDFRQSFFALDGVSDPGNLGSILRTCDWFGFTHLLCEPDSVDVFNPKVVQASMGAVFRVHVVYASIEAVVKELPEEFKVWAADMKGESLYELDFPKRAMVVFGSESHGLRDSVRSQLDGVFTIPRFGGGESLNVAVAAAITAAEIRRQNAR